MRLFKFNYLLIHLVRENQKVISALQKRDIWGANTGIISYASVGESLAFALKNKWGVGKHEKLENLLDMFEALPISSRSLANAYAEIDAFSQGRHPSLTSTFRARNMGKNDLWIAATTHLSEGTLLTTDNDFDHLMPDFLTVEKIYI